MARSKGGKVHSKGRIIFKGEGRQYLTNVDEEAILRSLLQKRCNTQTIVGTVSINIIAQGHELIISQTQSRSKTLHVAYKENKNE